MNRITLEELRDDYLTAKGYAAHHNLHPSTVAVLARQGRISPAIQLPNGVVLYHRDAARLPRGQHPAPTVMEWPEGTTTLSRWRGKHGLSPDQAAQALFLKPEIRIRYFGSFTLVRDLDPPALPPRGKKGAKPGVTPTRPGVKPAPERGREIVGLRASGLSFGEIGESLGVTRQRAHQLYRNALKREEEGRQGIPPE